MWERPPSSAWHLVGAPALMGAVGRHTTETGREGMQAFRCRARKGSKQARTWGLASMADAPEALLCRDPVLRKWPRLCVPQRRAAGSRPAWTGPGWRLET